MDREADRFAKELIDQIRRQLLPDLPAWEAELQLVDLERWAAARIGAGFHDKYQHGRDSGRFDAEDGDAS
jgi:hypothetical protein